MTALYEMLEMLAVFLAGLLVRLALTVTLLVAIATPILLGLAAWKYLGLLRDRLAGREEVSGLPWRKGLYYGPGHTWLRRDRGSVRLGIDGLAQRLLPDVSRVTLPEAGHAVRRGETIAEVASGSRLVKLFSPIDGTVLRANAGVARAPHWLEDDPYGQGWLVSLAPARPEWGRFLTGQAARDWLAAESARLTRFFEGELGVAAADGGEPIQPEVVALDAERFERLANSFLRAA